MAEEVKQLVKKKRLREREREKKIHFTICDNDDVMTTF